MCRFNFLIVTLAISFPSWGFGQIRAPSDDSLATRDMNVGGYSFGQPRQARQATQGQLTTQRDLINQRVAQNQTRRIMTRDGRVVFQFQNYDISIGGTPDFSGQGNGTGQQNARGRDSTATRVIWKSDQGSSWDGSSFFRSPNYNDSYTNRFVTREILGRPGQLWTTSKLEQQQQQALANKSMRPSNVFPPNLSPGSTKSFATLERLHSASAGNFNPNLIPFDTYGPAKTKAATEKIEFDEMAVDSGPQGVDKIPIVRYSQRQPKNIMSSRPVGSGRTQSDATRKKQIDTRAVNAKYLDSLRKSSNAQPFN